MSTSNHSSPERENSHLPSTIPSIPLQETVKDIDSPPDQTGPADQWYTWSHPNTPIVSSESDTESDSELSDLSQEESQDTILTVSDSESDSENSVTSVVSELHQLLSTKQPKPANNFWHKHRPYLWIGLTGAIVYLGYLVKTNHLFIEWFPQK